MRRQHPDELEADFQQYYNLDIADVKPSRAARLLFQLPRKSRTFCKVQPANEWGWEEVLLNKTTFLLELLAWQNTKDAQKKSPSRYPKQFVPEFMKDMEKTNAMNAGMQVMEVDDVKAFLARPRK